MGKRIFTKEVNNWILSEALQRMPTLERQDTSLFLDIVVELIREMQVYDPVVAEEQWYKNKARKVIASIKGNDGLRKFFSTRPASKEFVNIETCGDISKLNAVGYQLTKKKDGLNRDIKKNDRRKEQLTGQTPLHQKTYKYITFVDIADFL